VLAFEISVEVDLRDSGLGFTPLRSAGPVGHADTRRAAHRRAGPDPPSVTLRPTGAAMGRFLRREMRWHVFLTWFS
jgi:hypothetical protein